MKAAKRAKTAQVDPRRSAYILLICFVAIVALAGGAVESTYPKVTVAACAFVILAIVLYSSRKWVLRGSQTVKVFKVLLLLALTAVLTFIAVILFFVLSIASGGLTF
jgi:pheromone shutdown protein TraB